jgi:propionate CoA-transferase
MSKEKTVREAVELISSGATVTFGGLISLVAPEAVLRSLGERFDATGMPRDLTVFSPNRTGWSADPPTGFEHLARPGMVRKVITSTFSGRDSPTWTKMAVSGEIAAYSFPMGSLFQVLRAQAAGAPGFLTKVGLNTYIDPAAQPEAGDSRVNPDIEAQDLVRRVDVDGDPHLFYRAVPIDVAVIRGTVADPDGNISFSGEPVTCGAKILAMAARNSGGLVIAQVKYMTERGSLHPRLVEVPGMLVDAVVVDPDSIQSQVGYEPAITGEIRTPSPPVPPLAFDHKKIIMRRTALEMERGDVVNLGVGIGTNVPALVLEEGFIDDILFSVEHGAIGGLPAMGTPQKSGAFGAHYNPMAIMDSPQVFEFYQGGGLDLTCLGFAQIDAEGSVNVGWFSGNLRGPGGFLDIAHATRKLVFCGTLTAGGIKVDLTPYSESGSPPHVSIAQEGRNRKFIAKVEQVNLHGPTAVAKGQRVLIVTERAVFRVTERGVELAEIAPGIDIDRDIRPVLGFDLLIAPDVREMDPRLFSEGPMNFRPEPRAH